jgi:mRNA interferase MazF
MRYERGDVVLVLFPDSKLQTAKRRPALVVQATDLATGLSQIIIAMITSNMQRATHTARVSIMRSSPHGAAAGLLTDSVVMADNLATVHLSEIDRRIGALPDMTAIDAALRCVLAL